jgi:hypothetical protein
VDATRLATLHNIYLIYLILHVPQSAYIATRHATCGLQHQKRPYPPKPWAAVRACAVTLNTKLRVCRRGVISRKEMVRSASARSTEECVQCGPRSEFGVKEVAHENSGREEEGDRPGSLG